MQPERDYQLKFIGSYRSPATDETMLLFEREPDSRCRDFSYYLRLIERRQISIPKSEFDVIFTDVERRISGTGASLDPDLQRLWEKYLAMQSIKARVEGGREFLER